MTVASLKETTNGAFVHGMVWTKLTKEIIALEEVTTMKWRKAKKKRVENAFMDGDSDAIDYNADDPEDECMGSRPNTFIYDDDENQMKNEVSLRCRNQ